MKKFILLLGVLALGFTSCSKKSENLKVIPKDAMVVVSFDLQSLYKKADVEELQQLKSFQKLKEEISNDNKEMGKIFNEILKDPKSSGVDFKKNAFFFVCDSKKYGGDSRNPYIGVTAVLSDDAKFKDLLNRVSQATETQLDIKKEGALNIVYFNEGASLSWDNKKMLFLVNDNYSTLRTIFILYIVQTYSKTNYLKELPCLRRSKAFGRDSRKKAKSSRISLHSRC